MSHEGKLIGCSNEDWEKVIVYIKLIVREFKTTEEDCKSHCLLSTNVNLDVNLICLHYHLEIRKINEKNLFCGFLPPPLPLVSSFVFKDRFGIE